jgi:hypothetical protein
MRLSEWRAIAPARPSVDPKVLAVVTPVLESLGAGADPHCWAHWGDDVTSRWQLLVPTMPGLVVVFVRVNVAGEGPRASAKLVRWSRVQVGELAIETQSGHRILSFTVENAILKGVDAEADRVAAFALGLVSAIDGHLVDVEATFGQAVGRGRGARSGKAASAGKGAATAGRAQSGGGTTAGTAKGATKGATNRPAASATKRGSSATAASGPKAIPATTGARSTGTRAARSRSG